MRDTQSHRANHYRNLFKLKGTVRLQTEQKDARLFLLTVFLVLIGE